MREFHPGRLAGQAHDPVVSSTMWLVLAADGTVAARTTCPATADADAGLVVVDARCVAPGPLPASLVDDLRGYTRCYLLGSELVCIYLMAQVLEVMPSDRVEVGTNAAALAQRGLTLPEVAARDAGRRPTTDATKSLLAASPWLLLEEIAQRLGQTPRALQRALKLEGCAFRTLRAQAQMTRAKALLLTAMPTREVAAAVGFATSEHFVAAFRRTIGTPPGRWRREHSDAGQPVAPAAGDGQLVGPWAGVGDNDDAPSHRRGVIAGSEAPNALVLEVVVRFMGDRSLLVFDLLGRLIWTSPSARERLGASFQPSRDLAREVHEAAARPQSASHVLRSMLAGQRLALNVVRHGEGSLVIGELIATEQLSASEARVFEALGRGLKRRDRQALAHLRAHGEEPRAPDLRQAPLPFASRCRAAGAGPHGGELTRTSLPEGDITRGGCRRLV